MAENASSSYKHVKKTQRGPKLIFKFISPILYNGKSWEKWMFFDSHKIGESWPNSK